MKLFYLLAPLPMLVGMGISIHLSADNNFINSASQANLAEIQAGKLALQKGGASVKVFAQMMVDDHSKAQDELAALAQKENVAIAKTPDTEHQQKLANLQTLKNAAFDSAYLKSQLLDHQVALTLFQQESANGNDQAAKAYATKYLPALQMHFKMARKQFPEYKNTDSVNIQ